METPSVTDMRTEKDPRLLSQTQLLTSVVSLQVNDYRLIL